MSAQKAALGKLGVHLHLGRRPIGIAAVALLLCPAGLVTTSPASETLEAGQEASRAREAEVTLRVESLAGLARRRGLFGELPDPASLGVDRILAFEDNWSFLYLCGIVARDAAPQTANPSPRPPAANTAHVRRILLLKPSVVVIDDLVHGSGPTRVRWTLESGGPLSLRGREVSGGVGPERFLCRTLLPDTGERNVSVAGESGTPKRHKISLLAETPADRMRLLHLVRVERHGEPVVPQCILTRRDRTLRLELSVRDDLLAKPRTVELSLPEDKFSGRVGIFDWKGDGFLDLPTRPLPAGILPLGEAGLRMVRGWDIPYRDLSQGLAIWDTGRPSSELKKVVESGTIRACRAVELGCGTGTDAVYLAGKQFDVTAVDIAPTALRLAEEKEQKAGVKVRWLLADVLRPPELEPFDFLYDRGCYHAVRRDYPRQYVTAVRRLTRPGSRILILAGSAKKDSYWRFAGPPRVKEEEIRGDFAQGFKLIWLREFRFDPAPPETQGALAWSVLLERIREEEEAPDGRR